MKYNNHHNNHSNNNNNNNKRAAASYGNASKSSNDVLDLLLSYFCSICPVSLEVDISHLQRSFDDLRNAQAIRHFAEDGESRCLYLVVNTGDKSRLNFQLDPPPEIALYACFTKKINAALERSSISAQMSVKFIEPPAAHSNTRGESISSNNVNKTTAASSEPQGVAVAAPLQKQKEARSEPKGPSWADECENDDLPPPPYIAARMQAPAAAKMQTFQEQQDGEAAACSQMDNFSSQQMDNFSSQQMDNFSSQQQQQHGKGRSFGGVSKKHGFYGQVIRIQQDRAAYEEEYKMKEREKLRDRQRQRVEHGIKIYTPPGMRANASERMSNGISPPNDSMEQEPYQSDTAHTPLKQHQSPKQHTPRQQQQQQQQQHQQQHQTPRQQQQQNYSAAAASADIGSTGHSNNNFGRKNNQHNSNNNNHHGNNDNEKYSKNNNKPHQKTERSPSGAGNGIPNVKIVVDTATGARSVRKEESSIANNNNNNNNNININNESSNNNSNSSTNHINRNSDHANVDCEVGNGKTKPRREDRPLFKPRGRVFVLGDDGTSREL